MTLISEFKDFLNDIRNWGKRELNCGYQLQKLKAFEEAKRRGYVDPHIKEPTKSGWYHDRNCEIICVETTQGWKVIPFWNVTLNEPIEIKRIEI